MSVQSEIDRIITAVGNAYSKVSEKGGTVPSSQTVANLATSIDSIPAGGAKETWVIKSSATGELVTTQISFTSNGQKYTSIGTIYTGYVVLRYDNNEVAGYDPGAGSYGYEFDNEAYRKLTFDTTPTGDLLTWLQSNAVKQPDDTAVQDTKALTITSNGTISVTPDAPYDGLSSVDVTVNVSGGGGGENEGCIVQIKGTLNIGSVIAYTRFENGTITPTIMYSVYNMAIKDYMTLNVLKNSLFCLSNITENYVTTGNVAAGTTNNNKYVPFWVTGNCKINF